MRDWARTLRKASFRGVRFWVEQNEAEGGRRVAVHNIAGGEIPVTEDLGRLATGLRVQAYVASDAADAEMWALQGVCSAPGPAMLTLPMMPAALVRCLGCTPRRERDRAGYVAFDLVFVEAGRASAAGIATGLSALRLGFGTGLAGAALALSAGM